MSKLLPWAKSLAQRILRTSFDLFKVMIPIVLIIKLIEELGGIDLIGIILAPLMDLVGLPATMGLVWAATLLSGILGGMIIFVGLIGSEPLSVAQVTVLATMMLFAHSLPIEISIAKKAGVHVSYSLALRLLCALVAGMILNQIYIQSGTLSETSVAIWQLETVPKNLMAWVVLQLKTLLQLFIIIAVLLTALDLLRLSGIERLFIWLLQPLLRFLGLDKDVSTMAIVGMTLGLTYGGALIIKEAKYGALNVRQVFGAITLISVCHSLIEDTLLVMLLGAHISGVLFFRVSFGLILVAIGLRLTNRLSERTMHQYFARSVKDKS